MLIQVIGVLALLTNILSYQCNKHKNIMLVKLISETLFTIQYFLLGALTGSAMNLITVFREFVFYKVVRKGKSTKWYIFAFSLTLLIVGLLLWESWISIFAILGKMMTTVSFGMRKPKQVRLLTLPSCISWLVYNISCRSVAGIITEIFGTISILIGILRYDRKKQNREATLPCKQLNSIKVTQK